VFYPKLTTLNFTTRCNARCEMCIESGNKKIFTPYSLEEVADVLAQVAEQFPGRDKRTLHLWGGEPFLDLDMLFGVIREADRLGFSDIQVATNGFWGKNISRAETILKDIHDSLKQAKFSLQISCDNFHNSQPLLSTDYLANIIYLVETRFPGVSVWVNSLQLKDLTSLHDLARSLTAKAPEERDVVFSAEKGNIYFIHKGSDRVRRLRVDRIPLSLTGWGNKRLAPLFQSGPVRPEQIAGINVSPDQHISIGADRQMYLNLLFGSAGVLPMGSVSEQSVSDLVQKVGMDPIAVSLLKHGYSEMYPHLNRIFDFDRWAGQFYSFYDVLQGLGADAPQFYSS
jgi:MoaA/NifB/PqqE/SkfB family radical SAM enzyme